MAKELVHIALATATDGVGVIPHEVNMINLSAQGPGEFKFSQNLYPATQYKPSKWWDEHPQEFKLLKKDPIDLRRGLERFKTWLATFQGRYIAVSSSIDYWILSHAYWTCHTSNPFGGFVDINTAYMMRNGGNLPERDTRLFGIILPSSIAENRYGQVRNFVEIPTFGVRGVRKKKETLTTPPMVNLDEILAQNWEADRIPTPRRRTF